MPTTRIATFALGLTLLAATVDQMPVAAKSFGVGSHRPRVLVSGLAGAAGSTVGPDGALYLTEGATGTITRVEPRSGRTSTFATGLPPSIVGFGGPVDVAFKGKTAYALVSLVGSDVGGKNVVGIYRIDGRNRFTVIANIGAFSQKHPPKTDFFLATGVPYALESYEGGFLVTDGHHNRVLYATLDGRVSEFAVFGNIVPTGLAVTGKIAVMGQAGPVPHLPKHGQVLLLSAKRKSGIEFAAGVPLLVDVEFGCGDRIYALGQGDFPDGSPDGTPANPNTGVLVEVNANGSVTLIAKALNQPSSLEIVGDTAYVVSLAGEVLTIGLPGCQPSHTKH